LLIQKEPIDVSALANIADYEGSIESAVDTGQQLVEDARNNLIGLEKNEFTEAMFGITDFLFDLLDGCRQ
jgi:hypothetical protein